MSHFTLIAENLDVAPALREIDSQPWLWNHRPDRRQGDSPHRETSDAWLRYASEDAMREPGFGARPHVSVAWPAWWVLPATVHLVRQIGQALGGSLELGGVLMTRIGPGRQVYPHHDRGSWHAEHYDLKVWVPLRANLLCVNGVEDEEMVWRPGDAWSHDNLVTHWVRNEGQSERICLISCFRRVAP
jgi:hypothetical protein